MRPSKNDKNGEEFEKILNAEKLLSDFLNNEIEIRRN